MPTFALFAVMIICSIVAGLVWGIIPAYFKARYNTNETLFTLMMNYIAIQLTAYFCIVWEALKGSGTIGTINPVSYTHLDVYKRQVMSLPTPTKRKRIKYMKWSAVRTICLPIQSAKRRQALQSQALRTTEYCLLRKMCIRDRYEAGTYEDVPVVIELPDDVSMTSETVGVTVVLS